MVQAVAISAEIISQLVDQHKISWQQFDTVKVLQSFIKQIWQTFVSQM